MGKLNCRVCGTIYPDSAEKCPICGSTKANAQAAANTGASTPIAEKKAAKGGHYTKANVRKRLKANEAAKAQNAKPAKHTETAATDDGRTSIIVLALLVVIALGIIGYIVFDYVMPYFAESNNRTSASISTVMTVPEQEVISCSELYLENESFSLAAVGDSAQIFVSPAPANTTETISYSSSDPSVIAVDGNGTILAIASGEARIRVTCGNAETFCYVECTAEVVPEGQQDSDSAFVLNRNDVSFYVLGETFQLTAGNVDTDEIIWNTSNANIVSVSGSGLIRAEGKGYAEITAEYQDTTAVCIVRCDVPEDAHIGSENVSSGGNTGSDQPADYIISHIDVTVYVGGSFELFLFDKDRKAVDVSWISEDASVAGISGNEVFGVSTGMTTVYCQYEGKTYQCIVRVAFG